MKISEVIKRLQEIKNIHGDIAVIMRDTSIDGFTVDTMAYTNIEENGDYTYTETMTKKEKERYDIVKVAKIDTNYFE